MRIYLFTIVQVFICSRLVASQFEMTPHEPIRHFSIEMQENATPTKLEIRTASAKPLLTLLVVPDKTGRSLTIRTSRAAEAGTSPLEARSLIFWPSDQDAKALIGVATSKIVEQSWRGRLLPGTIRFEPQGIKIWLEGRLVLNQSLGNATSCQVKVTLGEATQFESNEGSWSQKGIYEPVPMAHLTGGPAFPKVREEGGIPFEIYDQGANMLSLVNAGWPEWKADLHHTCERQDGNSRLYLMDKGRIPFAQVPKADYIAAHVLAFAEDKPGTTNAFTFRIGRRNGDTARTDAQLLQFDFPAKAPYGTSPQVIRIPLCEAVAQEIEGDVLDVEITKEIRLARRAPDPSRFRWRPLGLPSNVQIAAITLEKSPIQMTVSPTQVGGLFEQPEPAAYQIALKNITDQPRRATVVLAAGEASQELPVQIPAGDTVIETINLEPLHPGYYPVRVTLKEEGAGTLIAYQTSLGILPPDTRKHREEAPWGTWDFGGVHFTPEDSDQIGQVMQKLGLRYGMFLSSPEVRNRYGVIKGNETKVTVKTKEPENAALAYRELKEKQPDLLPDYLIFHENAISGGHANRIPDLFHDRPPYQLNEAEQKEFRKMWEIATAAAKSMRSEYPQVKLHLGNGMHTLKEELYRNHFPSELFDSGGNESGGFGRPPESQPPDGVAVNAGIWMDRQLLDAYGYEDKPVYQCAEVIYPATNPGNLSLQTQADYSIRHILHAMVWKIPMIRPGCISDVGNSYYNSNWGGIGFMTRRPEWAPKPAAIALATLTRVLDGAVYQRFLETGSDSLYLLHFSKKEGEEVFPFWTVRGKREISLNIKGASVAKLTTQNGESKEIAVKEGKVTLTASVSPAWLELPAGASVEKVIPGAPSYPNSEPNGKVSKLSSLDSLKGWKVAETPNALLDYYNPMTPRRKGDFSIEEAEGMWKVTARPLKTGKPTMPMYAELISAAEIDLPGKPAEIGLWVDGNSSWGRIIFEMEDASGQKWTSIGARSKGGSDWMADWLGAEKNADYKPGEVADWNTDDVFGMSRISFDGWRYVGFPLPGQYPGEGYHWPSNSQWRWDKDGIVHYPLKLRKLIIELPEKVLYLTRFAPPKRAEIYLRDLIAVERDVDAPKSAPRDYVNEVQITTD